MGRYWKKFPPYHVLFAGYVGYKGAAAPAPEDELTIDDIMGMFPTRGAGPDAAPSPPPQPSPSDRGEATE